MLTETTGIVRQKMAAGKTLEQIKAEGLPEEWKPWGTGFIKTDVWIEIIHRSYSTRSANALKKKRTTNRISHVHH